MITVRNFSKNSLSNFNIDIKEGINFLKGRNGAGKTTLLDCIATLDKKYLGEINGNDSVVYLNQNLYFSDRLKAKDAVEFALTIHKVKNYKAYYFNYISKYKDIFDFGSLWDKKIGLMSGGERKLLFLSIIMCIDKKWYILDEPFASVDIENKKIIVSMLTELLKENKSIIITSHEENFINEFEEINIIHI